MSQVLTSWKEIANFMGKGVRTVQRWENTLRLPVHRPSGSGIHNVVFAIPEELTAWVLNDRASYTNGPRTALLFGADPELQNGVRCGLEEAGYIVLRCADEFQGRYVLELRPKISLIVVGTDVNESCIKLLQTIEAENANAQALVIEGSNISDKLGSRFIEVPRPISSESILRASIDEIRTSNLNSNGALHTPAA